MFRKTIMRLCTAVVAAACILSVPLYAFSAKAVSADEIAVFEGFEDYETGKNRKGIDGEIFQLLVDWSGNPAGVELSAGNPVGSGTKSLKITQKAAKQLTIWGNGNRFHQETLNQAGAKYLSINVRSLNSIACGIGFIVTDIPQSTVDGWATAVEGELSDYGQDHWALAWNKKVVLETFLGEKSVVRTKSANSIVTVELPPNFEGCVKVPVSALANPAWFAAENHEYMNGVLELERTFMVSVELPQAIDVTVSNPSSYLEFEIDNIIFGKDDSVDQYLKDNTIADANQAQSAVRPISSLVEVDFDAFEIKIGENVSLNTFEQWFSLPSGYVLQVNDEFGFPLSKEDILKEGSSAMFVKGEDSFGFTIAVKASESPRAGCNASIGSYTVLGALGSICAMVLINKKKREMKK